MTHKFSNKELMKTIDSGLNDLSCEQIRELIKKELEKDYEDIDTDFIDLCFKLLASKQEENNKPVVKKYRVKKVALVAAVVMTFVITISTVSANVFEFNVPKNIAEFKNRNAEIDVNNWENADTTADGYALLNTDLAKRLADCGITPVTFPEEMVKENCVVTGFEKKSDEISNTAYIDFEYNGQNGKLSIEQENVELEKAGSNTVMDIKSAKMIKANGLEILIFEQDGRCSIKYKDNLTEYDISIYCNIDAAIKFAESIK